MSDICPTIKSIGNYELPLNTNLALGQGGLVSLSFDGSKLQLNADLDLNSLISKDLVRAGAGFKVVKKVGITLDPYYEVSSDTHAAINNVPFNRAIDGSRLSLNLSFVSSDNSVSIQPIMLNAQSNEYALDIKSAQTGVASALVFKDSSSISDEGVEVSHPGGPLNIIFDGFNIKKTDENTVTLKSKANSISSINGVSNNRGNVSFTSTDKSLSITPNDSENTINIALTGIRSTNTARLSVSKDQGGTIVLNPGGDPTEYDWKDITPTATGTVSNPTFDTSGTIKGQYKLLPNKTVLYTVNITFGSNVGEGIYDISLPFAASTAGLRTVGTASYLDASNSVKPILYAEVLPGGTSARLYTAGGVAVDHDTPVAFASGDQIELTIIYRID